MGRFSPELLFKYKHLKKNHTIRIILKLFFNDLPFELENRFRTYLHEDLFFEKPLHRVLSCEFAVIYLHLCGFRNSLVANNAAVDICVYIFVHLWEFSRRINF